MRNLLAFKIGEEFWLKPRVGIESECLVRIGGHCVAWKGLKAYSSLGALISTILPNVYIIAGVILFFLLIGGGLTVIVSAGQENPEGAAKGKKAVTAALVGFLIIFASYWLIQIIEIVSGIEIFKSEL